MSTTMTITRTENPSRLGMPARVRAISPMALGAAAIAPSQDRTFPCIQDATTGRPEHGVPGAAKGIFVGTSAWRPPVC